MKTVWITGASSGLGEALATLYAQNGWHVIVSARNAEKLNRLSAQYQHMVAWPLDVTSDDCCSQQLQRYTQSVDLVIVNAGTAEYVDAAALDISLFQRQFDLNVLAAIRTVKAALPLMSKPGQIAFVSSLATELPFTRAQAYAGSKAALDYIAKSLYTDLYKRGISINLLKPGFIKTPLTDKNTFSMPFLITAENAAARIAKALAHNKAEYRFPFRMSLLLRIMACLPSRVLSKRLSPKGEV